jgi:hypothetical protein
MLQNLSSFLNPPSGKVIPYYTFTIFFDYPTTLSGATQIEWHKELNALSLEDRSLLQTYLAASHTQDTTGQSLAAFALPLGLVFSTGDDVTEIEMRTNIKVQPAPTGDLEWQLILPHTDNTIPFLTQESNYRIMLWSQAVDASNFAAAVGDGGGILGIYIAVMVAVGILLRAYTLRGVDALWISRMERPEKLYRLVIATEAFRATNNLEREYGMVQRLLDTLRSQEQCLRITASDRLE